MIYPRSGIAMGLVGVCGAVVWGQPGFAPLPAGFVPQGISGNGRVVVGRVGTSTVHPAMWTEAGGLQMIDPAELSSGMGLDASFDGSVIVGQGYAPAIANGTRAFRWNGSSLTMIEPGTGYVRSGSVAVSSDGATVIGNSDTTPSNAIYYSPFRWTQGGGLQALWTADSRLAVDASGDGSVVTGMYTAWNPLGSPSIVYGNGWRLAGATGFVQIETPSGHTRTNPVAISKDGLSIVGFAVQPGPVVHAFRWTPSAQGIPALGTFPQQAATAVSADGGVVVGPAGVGNPMVSGDGSFVWTAGTGTRDLKQALQDLGVQGLNDWTLMNPVAISDNGMVITGMGYSLSSGSIGWVATLGAACYANCDGSTTPPVLNVQDFSCFINRFASGDTYANCDGSTTAPVLNVQDFSCFLNAFGVGCS